MHNLLRGKTLSLPLIKIYAICIWVGAITAQESRARDKGVDSDECECSDVYIISCVDCRVALEP